MDRVPDLGQTVLGCVQGKRRRKSFYLKMNAMSQAQLAVREAHESDVSDILQLFRHAHRRFITFGEEDLPDLVRNGYVIVAHTGPLLWGVLVLSSPAPGWARVRGVGLIDGWQAMAGVPLLFRAATRALRINSIRKVDCVLTEAWLHAPLEGAGFRVVDRVVTYLRHVHHLPPVPTGPARLRLVHPDEIHLVEGLDAITFPPQWHFTWRDLTHMLTTGCRITVAQIDNELVGYVCVNIQGEFGHIVRLAVHPQWQEQGVGKQLMIEAMHYLQGLGATRFSLNTQQSNARAIKFYERLQFRRFGRVVPVLECSLSE